MQSFKSFFLDSTHEISLYAILQHSEAWIAGCTHLHMSKKRGIGVRSFNVRHLASI